MKKYISDRPVESTNVLSEHENVLMVYVRNECAGHAVGVKVLAILSQDGYALKAESRGTYNIGHVRVKGHKRGLVPKVGDNHTHISLGSQKPVALVEHQPELLLKTLIGHQVTQVLRVLAVLRFKTL